MIVLSLLLVIVAAVALLLGFFSEGLALIWTSIGACVLSIVFLAIGVMQRKRQVATPIAPGAPAYGPGASGTPRPAVASRPSATTGTLLDEDVEETTVITKTSAREAAERKLAEADTQVAVDEAIDDATIARVTEPPAIVAAPAAKAAARTAPAKKAAVKKVAAKKAAAKKAAVKKVAAKKAAAKKAAVKKAAAKKAAVKKAPAKKAAVKKAPAKKAAAKKATTGAAARRVLAGISGVGPAKQDALLRSFGSIEAIRAASVAELSKVKGVGSAAAETIKRELG